MNKSHKSRTEKTSGVVFFWIIIFLAPLSLVAQQWTTVQSIGSPSKEAIGDLSSDHLGNVYLSGTFEESINIGTQNLQSEGFDDVFLTKYNPDKTIAWALSGGGPNFDQVSALTTDAATNILWGGQFWVEGTFGNLNLPLTHDSRGIFLIKYATDGSLLWGKSIEGKGLKILTGIDTDKDNNIYLTGYFENSLILPDTTLESVGTQNSFLMKLNPQGVIQWARSAGYFGEIRPKGVAVGKDKIFIAGDFLGQAVFAADSIRTNTEDHDVFIAAYDTSGTVLWGRKAGGVHEDYGHAIDTDEDGNAYLTGTFFGVMKLSENLEIQTTGFNENFFLSSYSPEGEARLARSLGGNDDEDGFDLLIAEEQVLITGRYFDTLQIDQFSLLGSKDHFNAFVAAFDLAGNTLWLEGASSSEYIEGQSLAVPDKDRILLAGNFANAASFGYLNLGGKGFNDIFLASINPSLTSGFSITPKKESHVAVKVFPNPGSGLFQFSWDALETTQDLQLHLFNSTGDRQATIPILPEQTSVFWNADSYTAGIYFFQLRGKEGVLGTGKILLLE